MATETCVICWPAERPGYIVPGSTRDRCTLCGGEVSVSPSSREIIAERQAAIVCLPCSGGGMPTRADLMRLTPMQVGELFRGLVETNGQAKEG